MKILNSIPDYGSLLEHLNRIYQFQLDDIYLYRDMIGAVYFLRQKDKRFVYKLYRACDTGAAIQVTEIMSYLKSNNFPVAMIIPTTKGQLYSKMSMPEGERIGILFEHIAGIEPDVNEDLPLIGELTGRMHKLMESYSGKLRPLGKEHYIDRFIKVMEERSWEGDKIAIMDQYGHELWENIRTLPQGFCHGDLHTGNLLKTSQGEIIFLDFDIAARSYPIFDVATICDDTDFCIVREKDLEKTYNNLEQFCLGYGKEKELSQKERAAIFDCIAIHHYELNGTIPLYRVPMEGNHWLNNKYFTLHYRWAMDWKDARKVF